MNESWLKNALWIVAYMWIGLIVYTMISAVLGFHVVRRTYVHILRALSAFFGSRKKRKQAETNTAALGGIPRNKSLKNLGHHEFELADACEFISSGVGAIMEDEVTKCFSTEEVEEWNFLTRTKYHMNLSLKLEILLWLSVVFRFGMFFLLRLPIGLTSLLWLGITVYVLSVLGFLFPNKQWRRKAERYCTMVCCRLIAAAFSAHITIHNPHNRAQCGSVCVANHTTPIDIVMLAVDNSFTLVGQRHGGFMGLIQKACSLAQKHIWFERQAAKDRQMVTKRLKEHVEDSNNNPILLFPEGTCINNTSVFMFKKGCFELGATIYPVVIKYHRAFADPFWNSQEQGILTYLFMLMTSWAIVCDVYYLEPTRIQENETAIEFAQRVKADICRKGGLVDLPWDGMIKRAGNENYLRKLVEDERRMYCEGLQLNEEGTEPNNTN